jgi:hypothetical protein
MKFKLLKAAITGATLLVTGFANAGLITTNLDGLNSLTADLTQTTIGTINTFQNRDFLALNGTNTTSDASTDSATFKLSLSNLSAWSGSNDQYLFESGGATHGIGIVYQENNIFTFAQRTNGNLFQTISLDASSLIGESFDIIASISLDDNFMRLFVGSEIFGEAFISSSANKWAGGDNGAFGMLNSSSVMGRSATDSNFSSGVLTEFNYYHDIVVDVPEPTTLAIFALGIMGLAARRFKKQS